MSIDIKKTTVSVIIPTYNRAYLIQRAIQSVLNQTYTDFEMLIIDDGSKDNSEAIVKSILDNRIKYIRHEKNKGVAAARNTGIIASQGKYIAFLDSDDEWLTEKLEKQIKALENTPAEVGCVYTALWEIEGDNRIYRPPKWTKKEGYLHKSMLEGQGTVYVPTIMLKRECLSKAGMFDEALSNMEDNELLYRISKHYHFLFLEEPLVIVHRIQGSLITNPNAIMRASDILLQKCEDIRTNREFLAAHYKDVGHSLCDGGHLKEGRKYLINAYRTRPITITPLIGAVLSLFGQNCYKKAHALFSDIRERVSCK